MKQAVQKVIELYQHLISPWLGSHCRFYPSCSEWSKQAIRVRGVVRGAWLTLGRLLRCHPLHPGGYDPFTETSDD